MADEIPPKKAGWSSSSYKDRKAMRASKPASNSQSPDKSDKKSGGWDEFFQDPAIRKVLEEEAAKRQMVASAFEQATNPKRPKKSNLGTTPPANKPKMPAGIVAKFRAGSKVGTIYLLDWVLLAVIVGAAIAFGGVAMTEEKYTLAEILFFFGIGLFIVKAIYDHRNHELKTEITTYFIVIGVLAFVSLVIWVEWDRRHQRPGIPAPEVSQPVAETQGSNSISGNQPYPPIPKDETFMHKRFRTECPDNHLIWTTYDLLGEEFKGTYQIEVTVCVQAEVRAVALYMYLPSDKRTISAINRISDQYGVILLKAASPDLVEYPPAPSPNRFKLTFAGRIFIYAEDKMSDEMAVSLSEMFSKKGAAMTIAPYPDESGAYHLR